MSANFIVRAQHASDISVSLTSKILVRAQNNSDVAVGLTAKYIVRAQHASDVAVGVTAMYIVRAQHASDVAVGVTAMFIHPYEDTYLILRVIPPSTNEQTTTILKDRGEFNKRALKT